jgi:hypothetical protein
MTAQTEKFTRDLFISAFSVILTAAFGVAAWAMIDRQHWAAKEQMMDDDAKAVETMQRKIDSLPQGFVTRQEFEQVRELIQNDHIETINAITHLGERIDHLALMDGYPSHSVLQTPSKEPASPEAVKLRPQ